jgi:putative peptide zinc metalloprotease protein
MTSDPSSAAADRRLGLRLRSDLAIHAQAYSARRYYLVKDPVTLTYFHLGEEEHAILRMLEGPTSIREIQRRFEREFAPQQVTLEQLHTFLAHLYQSGLLLADAAGQGEELLARRHRRRRREWWASLGNILAIRFRGLDPERLLRWLDPRCGWLFSSWFLAACLGLVVSAVILVALHADVLAQRLSPARDFFAAGNLLWLGAALALAKTLHELGHALTCKHFGGECHEIGVLLLVFTPCLYCNVSDAWLLSSTWQRIAVAAAGIFVELVLASVCVFLWWFSEPGLLNTLALNLVVICSVNTLFLNGNPLLRYDGYYVLADWLQVPNLSQQARALVSRGFQRLVFGWRRPVERFVPERLRTLVAAYGLASVVYRWIVVFAILWGCYRFLQPQGLEVLAELLAIVALAGMLALPVFRWAETFSDPAVRPPLARGRMAALGLIGTALVAGVVLIPLPFRVSAPVVLQLYQGQDVYVVVPGRLAESIEPGQQVAANQPLARLVNLELDKEIADLKGQRDHQRARLQHLQWRLSLDPSLAPQIPTAEAALGDLEARCWQRQRDAEQLILRAPVAGTVIPAPGRPRVPYSPSALPSWQGSLLGPQNREAYLETGTHFCAIGDPVHLEGLLVIDQADIQFVRSAQRVRLKLEQLPGVVLQGAIVEVSQLDLQLAPRELAAERDLPVRLDRAGVPHPASVSYQARVSLDARPQELLVGARGQAKILADPQSLGARLAHRLAQVFRFTL